MNTKSADTTQKGVNYVITPASFAEQVVQPLLKETGWDQKTLAQQVRVHHTTVNKWLLHDTIPETVYLERLKTMLPSIQVNVDYWVFMREYKTFIRRCELAGISPKDFIDEDRAAA